MGAERPRYIPALSVDWLTGLYDPLLRLTMREGTIKRRLLANARLRKGQRLLDLGCGTGTLMLMVNEAYPNTDVVGLDGDPKVLAIARRKAAKAGVDVKFEQGSATALPYPAGSFDRVLSSLVLHHLVRADKLRALAEAWRVLRPGGELHIADFGRPQDAAMRAVSLLTRAFEETADNIKGRLPAMLRRSGFEAVREPARFRTVAGTISLYAARKPR